MLVYVLKIIIDVLVVRLFRLFVMLMLFDVLVIRMLVYSRNSRMLRIGLVVVRFSVVFLMIEIVVEVGVWLFLLMVSRVGMVKVSVIMFWLMIFCLDVNFRLCDFEIFV